MHGSDTHNPAIWLVGDVAHCDFADAVALLRSTASIGPAEPELIVVAQSRPGTIRELELNRLRESAPLAGVVSLLGSWCEGEMRTGRPLAETTRLYWYEFPSWWQRQLRLREAGLRPEWIGNLHPLRKPLHSDLCGAKVAIAATIFETIAAIGDAVRKANGQPSWWRENERIDANHAVDAGVWVGGQLSEMEAAQLALFCDELAQSTAPVVAILDFPRRDRCELARRAGAATVLGAPWRNHDLVDALRQAISDAKSLKAATTSRAA